MKESALKYAKGRIIEIGTGSGDIASSLTSISDDITAVDINPKAIKYCKSTYGKNVKWLVGDLFSNSKEIFDTILFNPPYLPTLEGEDPALAKSIAGGSKGYELTLRFLTQAVEYLAGDGQILLVVSTLTHPDIVERHADELLLDSQVISELELFTETLKVYRFFPSRLRAQLVKLGYTNITKFAQGKRGIIYTAVQLGTKYCIKKQRCGSPFTVPIEAEVLAYINKFGIGPKLVSHKEDYIIYQFVEGKLILDFLRTHSKKAVIKVLMSVFEQLRLLDRMHLNKEEMTFPYKHILVDKSLQPTLIDFERCRIRPRPQNVTQFCQFIISKSVLQMLSRKGIKPNKDTWLSAARTYKKSPTEKNFIAIISQLGVIPLSQAARHACVMVPKGKVTTYKDIAHILYTRAYRAIGNAMQRNPYAPLVPCHRVVNSDGSIGGFKGKPENQEKIDFLKQEGVNVKNGKIEEFEKVHFTFSS